MVFLAFQEPIITGLLKSNLGIEKSGVFEKSSKAHKTTSSRLGILLSFI